MYYQMLSTVPVFGHIHMAPGSWHLAYGLWIPAYAGMTIAYPVLSDNEEETTEEEMFSKEKGASFWAYSFSSGFW